MITNPSTLGLFESGIGELLNAVHQAGALAYMDGANLNPSWPVQARQDRLRRHASTPTRRFPPRMTVAARARDP